MFDVRDTHKPAAKTAGTLPAPWGDYTIPIDSPLLYGGSSALHPNPGRLGKTYVTSFLCGPQPFDAAFSLIARSK
jgi:hypothetical protein